MKTKTITRSVLLAAACVFSVSAQAQNDRPIRILVGFAPGGGSDTIARLIADKLQPVLKQNVIVENKPGVGGRLAAQAVKAAAPDGLTYMVAPNATFVFQHLTYPVDVLGYDMTKDFTSVARINSYPLAMVVNSGTGIKTVKDYVAWRKSSAASASFGTAGMGGETYFNGLQFGKLAGVEMSAVPYRGNAPLITDLLGAQIQVGNMVAGDALPHVKAGKLSYLGVFAPERSPLIPDVPTMAEQGFDTGGANGWMGLWAPAGLDKAQLARMETAMKQILSQPDVIELMKTRLLQIADFQPSAEVDRQLKAELAHWGPIIKASGFKPQQ